MSSLCDIIRVVAEEYSNYDGIDEIKRGIRVGMRLTGYKSEDTFQYLLTEVLYKLAKEEEA